MPVSVSILKPLKGADPALTENLRSFFQLKHPVPFELLFSLENANDPAYAVIKSLCEEFSTVSSKIYFSQETSSEFQHFGLNPKIKNLAKSYEEATHDVILISDSNVKVLPDMLSTIADELDATTGLVTSIVAGTKFEGVGGYLEAMYLNTFYARFNAIANEYAKPCVVGKSMLFRKSTATRFGGLKVLSQFLAEDFMAGESMARLGLRVKTAREPVTQIIGEHSFMQFWRRHERWGRIRKAHAPLAFLVEPLSSSLLAGSLGALACHMIWQVNFLPVFVASLLFCGLMDLIQFWRLSGRPKQWYLWPFFWLFRESLALPLWIWIGSSDTVIWRGNRLRLAPGGLLKENR